MEKIILEKVRAVQKLLQSTVERINSLTSGNVSHNIPAIRSITLNINDVMIKELINKCDKNDLDLKQLLEKVERNIWGVDSLLQQINSTNVENGKKHLASWIGFYADALDKELKRYEV